MTNTEFLTLASEVGHLIRRHACPTHLEWERDKADIKKALDRSGLTPAEFDANLKELKGSIGVARKRTIKLAELTFPEVVS